jgi:toxin-antitoxin system PIN domain toxin
MRTTLTLDDGVAAKLKSMVRPPMILVDANLLLHAYNPRAPGHDASRVRLEATLSGLQLVRFAWLTLWAFLRISTNPPVFERPLSMAEAVDIVSSWLAQPAAGVLDPGERHWEILCAMTRQGPDDRTAGHRRGARGARG